MAVACNVHIKRKSDEGLDPCEAACCVSLSWPWLITMLPVVGHQEPAISAVERFLTSGEGYQTSGAVQAGMRKLLCVTAGSTSWGICYIVPYFFGIKFPKAPTH